MPGINADRLLSLGDFMPDLREGSGKTGVPTVGVQQSITVPMGPPLLVDGATYRGIVFIAPCDGCFIKKVMVSAAVKMAGGTNTLAIDNYDASGNAARNVLSSATVDGTTIPAVALEGDELSFTTTTADRYMDKGDVLNFTLVCGTMTTDGQGYALTAVVIVPDVR
jgi:hypothetical protein